MIPFSHPHTHCTPPPPPPTHTHTLTHPHHSHTHTHTHTIPPPPPTHTHTNIHTHTHTHSVTILHYTNKLPWFDRLAAGEWRRRRGGGCMGRGCAAAVKNASKKVQLWSSSSSSVERPTSFCWWFCRYWGGCGELGHFCGIVSERGQRNGPGVCVGVRGRTGPGMGCWGGGGGSFH